MMDSTELQILFDAGALKAAAVVPAPLTAGYNLLIERKSGTPITMAGTRKAKGQLVPRNFKTLDAAAAAARKVGFRAFRVEL